VQYEVRVPITLGNVEIFFTNKVHAQVVELEINFSLYVQSYQVVVHLGETPWTCDHSRVQPAVAHAIEFCNSRLHRT
jgi:hypothetical protein